MFNINYIMNDYAMCVYIYLIFICNINKKMRIKEQIKSTFLSRKRKMYRKIYFKNGVVDLSWWQRICFAQRIVCMSVSFSLTGDGDVLHVAGSRVRDSPRIFLRVIFVALALDGTKGNRLSTGRRLRLRRGWRTHLGRKIPITVFEQRS